MTDPKMLEQISTKPGFLAALDQSGGSTPGALRAYGIPDTAYSGDAEMFRLMHEMRVRIMTSPAFSGDKIIGAILFEKTMDGQIGGNGRRHVPQHQGNYHKAKALFHRKPPANHVAAFPDRLPLHL